MIVATTIRLTAKEERFGSGLSYGLAPTHVLASVYGAAQPRRTYPQPAPASHTLARS